MSTAVRAWSATAVIIIGLAAVAAGVWLVFSDVTEYWSLLQVIGAGAAFVAVIVLVAAALVVLVLKTSSDDLYRQRRLLELYHDMVIKIDAVEIAVGHSRGDVTHTMTEVLTTLREVARNTEKKPPRKAATSLPEAEPTDTTVTVSKLRGTPTKTANSRRRVI